MKLMNPKPVIDCKRIFYRDINSQILDRICANNSKNSKRQYLNGIDNDKILVIFYCQFYTSHFDISTTKFV